MPARRPSGGCSCIGGKVVDEKVGVLVVHGRVA